MKKSSPYGKDQDQELRVIEKVVKLSNEKLSRLQKEQTNDRIYSCNLFYVLKFGKPNQNWNGQVIAAQIYAAGMSKTWHSSLSTLFND